MINEMRKDEVFKKWCFDTGLVTNKIWFDLEAPSGGDEVYAAFEAWQASANRDGFRLVPVEPTKEAWDFQQAKIDEHGKRINEALHLARNLQLGAVLAEGRRSSGLDLIIKALEGSDDA